jgi:hypothetical protein
VGRRARAARKLRRAESAAPSSSAKGGGGLRAHRQRWRHRAHVDVAQLYQSVGLQLGQLCFGKKEGKRGVHAACVAGGGGGAFGRARAGGDADGGRARKNGAARRGMQLREL